MFGKKEEEKTSEEVEAIVSEIGNVHAPTKPAAKPKSNKSDAIKKRDAREKKFKESKIAREQAKKDKITKAKKDMEDAGIESVKEERVGNKIIVVTTYKAVKKDNGKMSKPKVISRIRRLTKAGKAN